MRLSRYKGLAGWLWVPVGVWALIASKALQDVNRGTHSVSLTDKGPASVSDYESFQLIECELLSFVLFTVPVYTEPTH